MTPPPAAATSAAPGKIQTAVRWLLGAIFLAAGAVKLARPADFHASLTAYALPLPGDFLRVTAVAFPWLELLCGLALLADFWAGSVRFLAAALCLVFVAVLGQAVLRGLDLDCGCFGSVAPAWFDAPAVALGRALLLCAASVWLWLAPHRR